MKVKDYFRTNRLSVSIAMLVVAALAIVALWEVIDTFSPLPPRTVKS